MSGIFDSDYWRATEAYSGLIVGTAAPSSYALPPGAAAPRRHKLKSMIPAGKVRADGSIDFQFQEIKQKDIPDKSNIATRRVCGFCLDSNTNFERAGTSSS